MPIADFHRLPGDTPQTDTNLKPDELILSIDLPASPFAGHSHYLKVRDRASYDFALVSVAAALSLEGGNIRSARIVLGGVAHKPWRSAEAEQALVGKPLGLPAFEEAGQAAIAGASPYRQNRFKVDLVRRAVVRALAEAGGVA